MSEIAITPKLLGRMQLTNSKDPAYQTIFEVGGFNLTNISSRLIVSKIFIRNLFSQFHIDRVPAIH